MSSVVSKDSPVVKRKTLSHEEMDSIGQVDDAAVKKTPQKRLPAKREEEDDDASSQPEDLEPLAMGGIEPMEIEQAPSTEEGTEDDDLEALLGDGSNGDHQSRQRASIKKGGCCKSKRVGNITIVCGGCHERSGFGIVGPHFFGPPVVLLIVGWASHYFVRRAMHIGPISTGICFLFMVGTVYYLLDTSYRDPGVVMGRPPSSEDLSQYRWCDFCNVYQPPDGAHCPECNVCIAGYDHHCVWMGVCIGKKNMKSFMRFNMCWLLYLLYSVFWVTALGPWVTKHL